MNSGERFADYVLFEKLTTTAFGDCYRAGYVRGSVVDRHALIQFFSGDQLENEPFWQLVADRSSLVENLKDPHLGESTAFDRVGSTPYSAYAYSPGRSLDVFLSAVRDQKLPVPVALGLTAAHNILHRGRPVLHGFLVPDLIRLSSEGEIRVLGIEAAPGLRNQLATHPAFALYLAPEVRAGEPPKETDDVFSLGALLFHLLCGYALPAEKTAEAAELIDDATLAAGVEPIPPAIAYLLKNSLVRRADRIPSAVAWQQALGRIILDGEHNPTTFNLSFLMHTLFRQELEAELEELPQEIAFRVQPSFPSETKRSPESEEDPASVLPAAPPDEPQRPFLTGFMLSFSTAAVFIAAYFVFFHTPGEARTENVAVPRQILESVTPDLSKSAVSEREAPTLTEPDSLEPQGRSDELNTEPAADSALDIENQLEDLEANLRAEYEDRIMALEKQVATKTELQSPETESPVSEQTVSTAQGASTAVAAEAIVDDDPASDSIDSRVDLQDSGSETAVGDSLPTVVLEPPQSSQAEESQLESPAAQPEPPIVAEETITLTPTVVLQPPRLQTRPRPRYPAAARRLRKAATVQVRVLVDASGKVLETELPGPPAGFGFDGAAETAARKSRWEPATRDGEPVESWAVLTIAFQP
jgi:protein TonB